MKTTLLALLLIAPAAQANVADFTYSLDLQLDRTTTAPVPDLKKIEIAFDGYQVDSAQDCQLSELNHRLRCKGEGTVYPGLDEVRFRVKLPEGVTGNGELSYRFEDNAGARLAIVTGDLGTARAQLALEPAGVSEIRVAKAAISQDAADAPIPTEAELIVQSAAPAPHQEAAKKPEPAANGLQAPAVKNNQ